MACEYRAVTVDQCLIKAWKGITNVQASTIEELFYGMDVFRLHYISYIHAMTLTGFQLQSWHQTQLAIFAEHVGDAAATVPCPVDA